VPENDFDQTTDSFQNETLTGGARIEITAIAITTANSTLSQACLPTLPSPLVLDAAGGGEPAVGPLTDLSAVDEPACQPKLAKFPSSMIISKSLCFSSRWYDQFVWIGYSKVKDAIYCFLGTWQMSNSDLYEMDLKTGNSQEMLAANTRIANYKLVPLQHLNPTRRLMSLEVVGLC
jgi:hypothetical protein